jgi:hypothetical protein
MTGDDSEAVRSLPSEVPPSEVPASEVPQSEGPSRAGLSWSWELDLAMLLDAVSEPASWKRPARSATTAAASGSTTDTAEVELADAKLPDADLADAELAEYLDAVDAGRSKVMPLTTVAGRIAESLPTGPDLAGWLATSPAGDLDDGALAGMAASYRRVASWAQAGELAVIAELASRTAAADKRVGTDEHGRPARMTEDACGQVSLALTMSQSGASWWTDLAISLRWRLAATGDALRAGLIDLGRARAIAEATAMLDDEVARLVEGRVLPTAGYKTMGQLRAALRRAVIAADPKGAERRREEAERQAKVTLYPDVEGTASLTGSSLPGIRATAAMARVSALARALKASGAGGGIDLLRAQVFLGLLLGTLPYIPPAPNSPPDNPPPDDGSPDEGPPDEGSPDEHSPQGDAGRGKAPADYPGDDGKSRNDRERSGQHRKEGERSDHGPNGQGRGGQGSGEQGRGEQKPDGGSDEKIDQGDGRSCDLGRDSRGWPNGDGRGSLGQPPTPWPEIPAFLPPGPAAMDGLPPFGGGLLDLRIPWSTLLGELAEPGYLGRLGPITPSQAMHLADVAADDSKVDWRVILTDANGQAVIVGHVARKRARAGPGPASPAGLPESASEGAGLVKRVTVTIPHDRLSRLVPESGLPTGSEGAGSEGAGSGLSAVLARVLAAAERAADRAASWAAANAEAADGCAHAEATAAYRPPKRLWEFVTARDLTCRFPTCRQPAWPCDLDHTKPHDQGGRTCACNLGGLCRFHHQLKQHRHWSLSQPAPGTFAWTTPTGRTYVAVPDSHVA